METTFLGKPQLDWLRQGHKSSRTTWKVIASDMPIGLLVGDGQDAQGRNRWENGANGDGPALARELTVMLKDIEGVAHYTKVLRPKGEWERDDH